MSKDKITIPEGLQKKLEEESLWESFDTLVTQYPLTFSRILENWSESKYSVLITAIKIGMRNPELFGEQDQEEATKIGVPLTNEPATFILPGKHKETAAPAPLAPEAKSDEEVNVGPNIWDILTTGTVAYNPATKLLQFIFVIDGGAHHHTINHYIHMTITDGNGREIMGSNSRAITNANFNDDKKIPYGIDRWHTQKEGTNAGTTPFFTIKSEELPDSLNIRFKGLLPLEKTTDTGAIIIEDVETAVAEIIISKTDILNGQSISLQRAAE